MGISIAVAGSRRAERPGAGRDAASPAAPPSSFALGARLAKRCWHSAQRSRAIPVDADDAVILLGVISYRSAAQRRLEPSVRLPKQVWLVSATAPPIILSYRNCSTFPSTSALDTTRLRARSDTWV